MGERLRLARRGRPTLNEFERLYNEIAELFGWKLTRTDLDHWLDRLAQREAGRLDLTT